MSRFLFKSSCFEDLFADIVYVVGQRNIETVDRLQISTRTKGTTLGDEK
jgi:hypothetical protein